MVEDLLPQRMSLEEARILVSLIRRGRTLSIFWDGPDAYCQLVVATDPHHQLLTRSDEWPYDLLSKARNSKSEVWSDDRLVRFLRHFPREIINLEPDTPNWHIQPELIADKKYGRCVAAGSHCRTLKDVNVKIADYDSGSRMLMLVSGSLFQPWMPKHHWRGHQVPITLGLARERFDWGESSFEGHFMNWDDFFTSSVTEEEYQQKFAISPLLR